MPNRDVNLQELDDLPDPKDFPTDPQGSAAALARYIRALLTAVRSLSARLDRSERNVTVTVVIVVLIMLLGIGLVGLGVRYVSTTECVAQNLDALKTYVANSRKAATPKDQQQIAQIDATITQLNQQLGLFATALDPGASLADKRSATNTYVSGVEDLKATATANKTAILAGIKTRQDNPIPVESCG